MYLVDTNIVSLLDVRRRAQSADLPNWMERNDAGLFISVITLMEIEAGRLKLTRNRQPGRASEIGALLGFLMMSFGERVIEINAEIAFSAARLAEIVRPDVIELPDLLIAATAQVRGLTVLTRNLRHFGPTGVRAIDPLAALSPDA